jgi:putative heme iron utilization protein
MNVDPEIEAFQAHQASAAKLSFADECRTLVDLGRYGVLSTFAREHGGEYPSGSIVGFAADHEGRPLFALSSMSGHTGDLKANGKCSLTVTAPGFTGAAVGRCTSVCCFTTKVVCYQM